MDTPHLRIRGDGIIRIFYRINPVGDRVIEGIKATLYIQPFRGDSTRFLNNAFNGFKNNKKTLKSLSYYSKDDRTVDDVNIYDPNNKIRRDFLDGKCVLFVVGRFEYKNYMNNKIRFYDFIVKIYVAYGAGTFMYERNINYDQK